MTKRSSGGRYGSGVDEDEWQRAKQLVLIKARRYQLDTVEVSDRLLIGMDDEQRKRLQVRTRAVRHTSAQISRPRPRSEGRGLGQWVGISSEL